MCLLSRQELSDREEIGFSALVHHEDWPSLLQGLRKAALTGRTADHTFRLLLPDEQTRHVRLQAVRSSIGPFGVRFCAIFHDTGLRLALEAQLGDLSRTHQELQSQLYWILDRQPVGLFRRSTRTSPFCSQTPFGPGWIPFL